jgi:sigma-B regulation protein RsbU (phosphoserine phosphatase)
MKQPEPFDILLVGDQLPELTTLEAQIAKSGADLRLACTKTLASAVDHLRHRRTDVVLLDLALPDSQGLATFRLLDAVVTDTPIVIITGQEDAEDAVAAVREGAQDYLLKSKIDADALMLLVPYMIERARRQRAEGELRAAGAIQQRLFPRSAPQLSGLDVAGLCSPAEFVGGDFFDFFRMGRDCVGIVIADVAGHGIGPAITMSETRAVIRTLATVSDDVGQILTRASSILANDLEKETFVALFLASLDVPSRTFQFATAGHPGFILNSAGRTKQLLKSKDPPLGVEKGRTFTSSPEISLDEGDALFLFTDGLVESVDSNGEEFGRQRVFEAIRQQYLNPAATMLDDLFTRLSSFTDQSGIIDDITAVLVKAQSRAAVSQAVKADDSRSAHQPVTHEAYGCFEVDKQADVTLVRLLDEEILSAEKCSEVTAELTEFVAQQEPPRLVLSFHDVRRFSSEGINMCLRIKGALDAKQAELRLCDMHPLIREAFKALNLDGPVFTIRDDVKDALSSF